MRWKCVVVEKFSQLLLLLLLVLLLVAAHLLCQIIMIAIWNTWWRSWVGMGRQNLKLALLYLLCWLILWTSKNIAAWWGLLSICTKLSIGVLILGWLWETGSRVLCLSTIVTVENDAAPLRLLLLPFLLALMIFTVGVMDLLLWLLLSLVSMVRW